MMGGCFPKLVLTLHSPSITAFSIGENGTKTEEELLRNSTCAEEHDSADFEIFYVFTPILLLCFLAVVLCSALNYHNKRKKLEASAKEIRKQEALGRNYGACRSSQELWIENQSGGSWNEVISSYPAIALDGPSRPYLIHPVI